MNLNGFKICFSEEEDDLAIARDIAEFEKNKHLAKPSNFLSGMKMSNFGQFFIASQKKR